MRNDYEAIIGLEVHTELKTATKLFCGCSTAFGGAENTQCCPVCLGLPGALPVLNRRAVELAILAGLALGCEIGEVCRMDRKQYFYPDLPKAYQISQEAYPVCRNGCLEIEVEGERVPVAIQRIHVEEDAGKLIHRGKQTLVDCNRCGVPLIEIVSAPCLHTGAQAAAYLRELRLLLVTLGITDGKMQEGSLRCDVNLSLRKKGSLVPGVRTEIKNLNSFTYVEKAIAYEIGRQLHEIETTGRVLQQTLRYDAERGVTYPMRQKQTARDYRFLIESDLRPFRIARETVERMRGELPELPAERRERLQDAYGLAEQDAAILVSDARMADYYERAAKSSRYPRVVASLLLSDLLRLCASDPFASPLSSERLAELADLAGDRTVNRSVAKKLLLRIAERDESPTDIANREQLTQINDRERIRAWAREVLAEDVASVTAYRNGKTNAFKALQGELMAKSQGRADPVLAREVLMEALEGDENG